MEELYGYVNTMLRYSKMVKSRAQVDEYCPNAFGACEMFIRLFSEYENEIVNQWNNTWKLNFKFLADTKES